MSEQPYQATCGACPHSNVLHDGDGPCQSGRMTTFGPNGKIEDTSKQCKCPKYDRENETEIEIMCALPSCPYPYPDRACEKCGLQYHASYEWDCLFRHECSVAYREDREKLKAWTEAALP